MKVFVRAADLPGEKPMVIASYADDVDIADDAHGQDVNVLTLPAHAIVQDERLGSLTLAENWRERAGGLPVRVEAKRRIEEAFTISDQLNALHEVIDLVVKHGTDATQWPTEARQRKAELDERWEYIGEVRERVRAHAPSVPLDPHSDKVWPRRLTKK